MWFEIREDFAILAVRAQPGASKNAIVGVHDDALKVAIKAPPVDGAANKELIAFFSKEFKIPKSEIVLIAGQSAKRKRIKMPLSERLREFLSKKRES